MDTTWTNSEKYKLFTSKFLIVFHVGILENGKRFDLFFNLQIRWNPTTQSFTVSTIQTLF
jgi:hypothetical protein